MREIIKYFPQLTKTQIEQFEKLFDLYKEWNEKINVISRKDFDNFYLHHVLHSLAIAKTTLIEDGQSVIDVGCGGGFPVVPLAIFYPNVNFTAVDSIGKKIKVVSEVVAALGLTNVEPINARVESIDKRFDWVVSRAVTDLKSFVGWTWSKANNGIIYLKGGDLEQEIAEAKKKVLTVNISDFFQEQFFETKKILVLPK